jgi:hypothetical protein
MWDGKNKKTIFLLMNRLVLGATTIALIYRDRWQIEMFFKTIKQNLKDQNIHRDLPQCPHDPDLTALIAIHLLKYPKFHSSFVWSISNPVAILRYNLFTYRDLWA